MKEWEPASVQTLSCHTVLKMNHCGLSDVLPEKNRLPRSVAKVRTQDNTGGEDKGRILVESAHEALITQTNRSLVEDFTGSSMGSSMGSCRPRRKLTSCLALWLAWPMFCFLFFLERTLKSPSVFWSCFVVVLFYRELRPLDLRSHGRSVLQTETEILPP